MGCNSSCDNFGLPLGPAGASAFLYVASADDLIGTNFTYPQNAAQAYVAFLPSTVAITSPVVANFAGLWRAVSVPGKAAHSVIFPIGARVVNPNNTTKNLLLSFVMNASELKNPGDRIHIQAVFSAAANANPKTFYTAFGATEFGNTSSTSGDLFKFDIWVDKYGVNQQAIDAESVSKAPTAQAYGLIRATETDANPITITFSAQSSVAAASDIVLEKYCVTKYNV
jgi:hypothetical protein